MQENTLVQFMTSGSVELFVKNHIHVGLKKSQDLPDGHHMSMWSGQYYMIRRQMGINKIADAPIQGLNLQASNGVIHAIGEVLGRIPI